MPESRNELSAKATLDAYRPGLFARLFKLQQRQIGKLTERDEIARALDAQEFEQRVNAWRAERLLARDTKAKMDAIELFHPFEVVSMLGSSIAFQLHSNGVVEAVLNIHGERVVPSEIKSLLQSGKLSTNKMLELR